MNASPSPHREVVLDLPDPPRIDLRIQHKNGASSARHAEPLSLEAELAQTRALRLRCEALLGELGCQVEVDQDLQRGAA